MRLKVKLHGDDRPMALVEIVPTERGWRQRFVRFLANVDATERDLKIVQSLNVDYVSRETYEQLEDWWRDDFDGFAVLELSPNDIRVIERPVLINGHPARKGAVATSVPSTRRRCSS